MSASSRQSLADNDGQSSTESSAKLSMKFEDEISMLSLSQTFSFWDNDADAGRSMATNAETFASDDEESFGENSLLSASTFGGGERGSRYNRAPLVACGEGIEDASSAFVDSLVDTGRAISYVLREGSKTKTKLVGKLFMTAQEREQIKKDKAEKLEEEMKLKREEQRREEMRNARDEVGKVADLWRERAV